MLNLLRRPLAWPVCLGLLFFVIIVGCVRTATETSEGLDPIDRSLLARGPGALEEDRIAKGLPSTSTYLLHVAPKRLRQASLQGELLRALPPDAQDDYRRGVLSLGFDPVVDVDSLFFWSDATDIAALLGREARSTALVFPSGRALPALLEAWRSALPGGDQALPISRFDLALIGEVPPESHAAFRQSMERAGWATTEWRLGPFSRSAFFCRGDTATFLYSWPGGVVSGFTDTGDGCLGSAYEQMVEALHRLDRLSGSDAADPAALDQLLFFSGMVDGATTELKIGIGDTLRIRWDLSARSIGLTKEEMEELVTKWRTIREAPQVLVQRLSTELNIPDRLSELLREMVVHSGIIDGGTAFTITVEMPTDTLRSALPRS